MSKIFRATSALSLAITTIAALSVTDVSFALEASDETPESEIFVDPALLEADEANQAIIFADQQEVVAEIPEDVVESDKIANGEAERDFDDSGEFINDGSGQTVHLFIERAFYGLLAHQLPHG